MDFNSLLKMSNKSHLPQRLKVEQCFNEHFAMIQEQKADVHNELKMWKIVACKAKIINVVYLKNKIKSLQSNIFLKMFESNFPKLHFFRIFAHNTLPFSI